MIKDVIINRNIYNDLPDRVKTGLEWLEKTNLSDLDDGRYEIDGNNLYANVQTYETKDTAKYEAHRKYIDIQSVISGRELVGVCSLDDCNNYTDYDAENDIQFMDKIYADKYETLYEGEFIILYPEDAHKPSIKYDNKQTVRKVVVKVLV